MTLRNFSLMTLLLLLVAAPGFMLANTKSILVEKEDGGEWGYYIVTENHQQTADGSSHSLCCSNPGLSVCTWQIQPTALLIPYAENSIANGQLSGSHSIAHMGTTYTVTWEALNAYNCKIIETQSSVGIE